MTAVTPDRSGSIWIQTCAECGAEGLRRDFLHVVEDGEDVPFHAACLVARDARARGESVGS